MSQFYETYFGFGFELDLTEDKLKNFLTAHRNSVEGNHDFDEVFRYLDAGGTELFEEFYNWGRTTEGVHASVAEIMRVETGIMFVYGCDSYCTEVLYLPQSMPWENNKVENSLTEQSLFEILQKYSDELGGRKPGYVKLEYFD